MTDDAKRRARAARIRAREGVPEEECLAELGYEAVCDCDICAAAEQQG
ncbi:hypothetical protein [Nocardiopsis halophila]|nr:hypothetical protein [Nocardiopsis halophila]